MLEVSRPKQDKRVIKATPFSKASKSGAGKTRVWAIPEVTNVSTRRLVNMLSLFRTYDTAETREIQRYVLGRDLHVPR